MEPAIGTPKRSLLPPVPTLREQPLACETFSQPPLDGSLCTAEIYEWHARHSPNHPVFQYLEDDGTVKTITFADAIHAIYRGGWLLRSAMQGSSYPQGQRQIVATVALSETISYCIVTLATQRANFILFPISPRNSPAAVAHLLTQVHADLLLVGQESSMQNLVNNAFEYMKSSNVDVHLPPTSVMPTFADVFPEHAEPALPLPPLQYNLDDVTMIMHSSGSTAFPKPIPWTFFRMTSLARLPYYGEVDFTGLRIAVHSVPMFHGMGTTQVGWVGAVGTTMTCFKPTSPPRARAPGEMLREAYALKSDYIFCTPHFPEAWSKNSEDTEMLKQMRGVLFGGGPLMKEAGDSLVASGVNMYLIYGCTEYGIMNSILPKTGPKEWEYFSFGKTVRTHWVVQDEGSPGISKLILLDGPLGSPSVTNCVIDGIPGFDTNDLFSVHPTNPDLWKIYGRADDQIMHSIGEKTNPGPLEAILNRDNHISHAIMFGRGRFNVGVLVDPIPELRFDPADTERLAAFRNLIWPTIERMNEYAPQHSRVFKEMIIVSSSNKPFSYTGKGTPRRHAIVKEYSPEIDALYATVAESTQASVPPPRQWNMEETLSFVRAIVNNVLERTVQDPQDIFQHGCDSLQATWIRNSVLHALRATSKSSTREIPINFVYNNPTVSRLASFVYAVTNSGYSRTGDRSAAVQAMQDMLNKYTHRFSLHAPANEREDFPTGDVALLTGSTGSLGSALLTQLVAMPEVTKIYALNRKGSTTLRERQGDVLSDRGYDADEIIGSSKVVLLEADLTQSTFGLLDTTYKEIRESVTHIIHNAWPVNFNLSLSSFEPSIKGLRSLIDLALSSPRPMPPRVIYISSQGVLRDVDHRMPIKEQFVDASVAVGTGYSESKWVAEEILASTTRQTRLPTISIRLGQVAGSRSGAWNVQEWVPSLIKTSLSLGHIPMLSEDVTWMNADDVARAVLEARSASPDLSPIHIQHPRPVPWRDVFGPIAVNYGLSLVPFDSWFASLYESAKNHHQHNTNSIDAAHANPILPAKSTLSGDAKGAQDITPNNDSLQVNPALKLLSFFSACNDSFKECGIVFPRLDITKSQSLAARKSLGEEMLNPLMLRDVRRWLKYWERVGFLPPVPTFK